MILKIVLLASILVLDLVSKHLLDYQDTPLIDGVISFRYEHNTGGAWGVFGDYTWVLALFSFVFVVAFVVFDKRAKIGSTLYNIAFAMVIAGTVGNMIDRVVLGYVRDFIYLDFLKTYPIFNVADMSLVVGMILLAIYILFVHNEKEKNGK